MFEAQLVISSVDRLLTLRLKGVLEYRMSLAAPVKLLIYRLTELSATTIQSNTLH